MHSHWHKLAIPISHITYTLLATFVLLFVTGSFLYIAYAGGSPYDAHTWAGARVSSIFSDVDNQWHTPDTVNATWQIPCLTSQFDGQFNPIDMWIGLEAA